MRSSGIIVVIVSGGHHQNPRQGEVRLLTAYWRPLPAAWRTCLLCLAGYLVLPWPAAKLALAAAAAAAAAVAPALSATPVQRRFALGLCFALALVALPYWLYFQGSQPAPYWQFACLAGMAWGGWVWVATVDALTVAAEPLPPIPWWKACAVVAALLALNGTAFYQVVPSRGDESAHILRLWLSLRFAQTVLRNPAAAMAVALAAVSCWLRRRSRLREASTGLLGAAAGLWICSVIYAASHFDLDWLPRYPGLQIWLQATALLYAPFKSWVAREALYRVVPFLAVVLLALYIARGPLARSSTPVQVGAALAIATAPVVRYYSTLLYLDLPFVAAMAIVSFEVERLTEASRLGKMPASAGWYALILAGFLKETALLLLVIAFLFCVRRGPRQWLRMGWALGAPLVLFLVAAGVQRSYSFRPANWLVLSNYRILGAALWDQYGLLLALALVGVILLAAEKRWLVIAFSVTTTVAYTLFYLADGNVTPHQGVWTPKYLGYARFLLVWLPAVAVFGVHALRLISKYAAWLATGCILIGNVWVYPVRTVAAPNAHWGDYVYDTGDHFYPYNTVFERGPKEFPQARRVVVVGADFFYPYFFYQRRWNWPESVDSIVLPPGYPADTYLRSLQQAVARSPDLIWVHVMSHLSPAVIQTTPPGYLAAREYRSRFERILVYSRAETKEAIPRDAPPRSR